ncbi:MAG: sugar nucleotide-binding protein, partial [Desulforhabdus sp.]|nr:sugar nucleotide-binding protein [Desulforhabdus sp.]
MKKLLVTGASGFLGWNICRMLKADRELAGIYLNHSIIIPGVTTLQTDLADYRQLKELFILVRPDAVIHCAAISNPNFCQLNWEQSYLVNVEASINIAGLCSDRSIACLFTSSDLVFDGLKAPYREQDPVCPVNVYGEHKVLTEQGMIARYPEVVVCRMPLMFGDAGPVASSFIQPTWALKKADPFLLRRIDPRGAQYFSFFLFAFGLVSSGA